MVSVCYLLSCVSEGGKWKGEKLPNHADPDEKPPLLFNKLGGRVFG